MKDNTVAFWLIVCLMAFILILCLFACKGIEAKTQTPKYSIGDVVYLKPDSTKAIISNTWSGTRFVAYSVRYSDSLKVFRETDIDERLIYGK